MSPARRKPPRARDYLAVVAGVWIYLAIQAAILSSMLRVPPLPGGGADDVSSSRGILMMSILLGLGFAGVCAFDWLWLSATRRPRPDAPEGEPGRR